MNELDLFVAALALTDPAEQAAYLDRACADAGLRRRLDALLAGSEQSRSPLDQPAATPLGEQTLDPGRQRSTADHVPVEQAGAVIAGKYTLVDLVGEGGMGSVWRARQTEPVKRFVAVKLIKAGMDSKQVLARFEAERQALALMDHPNIAKVLDGGLTGEPSGVSRRVLADDTRRLTPLGSPRPFFVMELVKGVPITEYCDRCKLTPKERLELFVPVCQAIQHAHQKGIIHRDIKPNNVLIALYDDKPVVKVIDFGVAKATGGALTEHTIETGFGAVVGTPQYMSPEQATFNNLDIDTRTDVYALGVLLYELLAGSPPFARKELAQKGMLEILRVVREEEPPRPSAKLSTADALPTLSANRGTEPKKLTGLLRNELDWIVMKALEKDRTRRYETANGFAADVLRYLSGEAVQAHPPSTAYRVKKFVRRHKGQVIAASLVLLALVSGVVGTTLGLFEAKRQEGFARTEAAAKERALVAEKEQREKAEGNERQALAAKERERAQRVKAEKAYARTADVLDTMVSEVTGDSLATQKTITAEQKKFLTEVLTYYQEFAGEKADDEKTRLRTARAASRVGMIESRLGRKEESAAAFRGARDVYAVLAADCPAVPAYRRDLANRHNNLGILLNGLGKRPEAEEQYRKALVIQEKLAIEFPAVPAYRQELARSHNSLGALLAGLGKRPEAEEQYRTALVIQEKLAADFPAVSAYRQDLARSHNSLGALLAGLGKRPEAEEQYRTALVIQEKLAIEFPAVSAYRQDLARSHNNLGLLLAGLWKRPEAEEQYRKALAIREKLAAEFPAVPAYRQGLAASHHNLGRTLKELGKRPEAEEQHRKALAIQEKLAAEFPAVPAYRQELATSHLNLGALLYGLGKRPEAEEQYRKALAIQEKLAAEFPAVPAYRVELGGSYCNFGHLVREGGKPSDRLEWYAKAIRTLAPIHDREPRDVTARQFLRNSHWGRAEAYDRLQQFAEAIPDWDKAIELSPKVKQPGFRASRATSRLRAGQVAQALAEVAELTKSSNWNADQWYDFACVYAVAAAKVADKKQPYADRAMALLRQAVKAGYKDAAHMKADTDLDALRGRADFKRLLAELGKTEPKK